MSAVSWALSRFLNENQDSEMFMTAKHSIKTGLTASAVVSSWTIAPTLLTSTTYGYQYGVSGPFWYAAGAAVQILLFSVAAIELKRKAPHAQTFLQVVKVRYGKAVHAVITTYSLVYQILKTVNLLVGGSTIFSMTTGVNRDAICLLFPVGVIIYTLMGGIKATFITDWVHTVIIYIIMIMTLFVFYATSDLAGSPGRVWELLRSAAEAHPVDGNADGEYLTMRSQQGGFVGLVFIGAGFAACVDSQLFQKAIASDPRSTSMGYIIGGLCWFTIPFVLASTYGIAAVALEQLPAWPTYPNRMNSREVSAGMAMPYAALALMGKGGAVAVLLMIFMAVTSAMSSETVATTALVSYNIYKPYIRPQVSGRELLTFSHFVTVGFGICTACIAIAFNHGGFSVGFLVTAIGIFVDSSIVPMMCTIMWRKQSRLAAMLVPPICSCAGIVAWFLTAYTHYDTISIDTLGMNEALVAGNMMALTGPFVLTPLITYMSPENFDWRVFKTEIRPDYEQTSGTTSHGEAIISTTITQAEESHDDVAETGDNETDAGLLAARNRSLLLSVGITISLAVLWPVPMYASSYIFSKPFFTGWVAFLFIWAFVAATVITILPVWEGRHAIISVTRSLFGASNKVLGSRPVVPEKDSNDGYTAKAGEKAAVQARHSGTTTHSLEEGDNLA